MGDSCFGRWVIFFVGFMLVLLVLVFFGDHVIVWRELVVLVELGLVEQWYWVVLEVLEGVSVIEVVRWYGVIC